jgi:hypothetical protein
VAKLPEPVERRPGQVIGFLGNLVNSLAIVPEGEANVPVEVGWFRAPGGDFMHVQIEDVPAHGF